MERSEGPERCSGSATEDGQHYVGALCQERSATVGMERSHKERSDNSKALRSDKRRPGGALQQECSRKEWSALIRSAPTTVKRSGATRAAPGGALRTGMERSERLRSGGIYKKKRGAQRIDKHCNLQIPGCQTRHFQLN